MAFSSRCANDAFSWFLPANYDGRYSDLEGGALMKKLPSLEETLARVARVSKMGDKVVSITRKKQPTKAQKKKLLLTFLAEMTRILEEGQKR